jgi:amino acid adenylation domain-containing protein
MNRARQRIYTPPRISWDGPAGPPEHLLTLVDVARWRAECQPDELIFTFLVDGENEGGHLAFRDLDGRARSIAAHLQSRGAEGERVLLLFSPGLDYVAAVFGCFYAGALPVPAYPPDPFRMDRTFPRLQAICVDAQAKYVLTSEEILAFAKGPIASWTHLEAISVESIGSDAEADWRPPALDPRAPALLQYTSGSTGSPRGVMLSHANILHNLASMHRVDTEGVGGVCWLPPYHDMGLIGGILQAVYSGRRSVLMSPLAFIQRPARWLWAMSKYRGRTSGGPNFAFELCLQKIQPAECEGLDLSSWTAVVSGAEPVRAETIERFSQAFAPYGFRPEAFLPGYGMAESVLAVTGGRRETPPVICSFDADALLHHRVEALDSKACPNGNARRLVGCGQPIPDGEIAVVDPKTRRLLAAGRVGEIWVRSPSVGIGYWNRPEETHEVFHAEIVGEPGKRYLRTGDLGFLHDGELFVTGRLKELIILGGRNYYPHDIERTVERSHPALKPDGGAAFGVEKDGQERLVVVHEVPRPRRWNLDEILRAIRRELAEEHDLCPAAVVLIRAGTLPKTSSGKTRRRRCRELFLRGQLHAIAVWQADADPAAPPAETASRDLPATDTEKRLAHIWNEVLGHEPRSRGDNFFALGGHSLPAVRLAARINAEWNLDLSVGELFEHPTLAGLAQVVDRSRERSQARGSFSADKAPLRSLPPAARCGLQPLSFAQERLWLWEQISPGGPSAVVPVALRLEGILDTGALRRAIETVIARHETLRTRFVQREGRLWQEVVGQGGLSWEEVDLRELPPWTRTERCEDLSSQVTRRRLDLESGNSFHVTLARTGEREYAIFLVLHHIVCDGWSLELLLREIAALYDAERHAKSPRLTPLPVQYVDYVHWHRRRIEGERLEQGVAYWKERLADAPRALEIPTDHPRRFTDPLEGAACSRRLSAALYRRLETLARDRGCTPFMVFLSAFSAWLARYAGVDDLCVGTPVANRPRPELEPLIGCFVNTVVLRCDLSGNPTFAELMQRVRDKTWADLAHAEVPFEKLVAALEPVRVPGRLPLVQTLFILQAPVAQAGMMDGVLLKEVRVDYSGLAAFDLTLIIEPRGQDVAATLVYNRAWFEPATIDRMLDSLVGVLEAVADDPTTRLADLPIPAASERRRLLVEWNATARPVSRAETVHELCESQAARSPDSVAIVFEGQTTTYGDLDRQSNRLARYLRELGVGPGTRVGIHLERSPHLIAAMLAVLKAGACYVPLDPAFPSQRLASIIADSGLGWILSEAASGDEWPIEASGAAANEIKADAKAQILRLDQATNAVNAQSADPLPRCASGGDLAYLIYTSGSTGTPKGVMIPHRAVVNFLGAFAEKPGLSESNTVLAVTTISFDIAVFEIFLPLAVGARIVLAPRDLAADGWRLGELIQQQRVDVIQATPSTFRMLLSTGWRPRPGQRLLCGGEAISAELAARLALDGVELWNVYGPTETTVWSTIHRVEPADCRDGLVPIGRPIANTQVYVLDHRQLPVPMGVPGELYIGGAGLAQGYWNLPGLTAERFVEAERLNRLRDAVVTGASPGDAAIAEGENRSRRLYRTGDRVRWRGDGVLEFFGRLDRQVKVRGFRVELGEVESVLATHPQVAEAAAVSQRDASGAERLVAYVVPAPTPAKPEEVACQAWASEDGEQRLSPQSLRDFLAHRLPDYMVPAAFVILDSMPRTPAGKVDLQALANRGFAGPSGAAAYVAPRTPLEEAIAALWAEVLGVDRVGINDNFFELGGHSLLATQMMSRLRDICKLELPLKTLFDRPTVAGVAEAIVLARLEQEPVEAMSRMLERLEQISDDEARRLLDSGQAAEVLKEIGEERIL